MTLRPIFGLALTFVLACSSGCDKETRPAGPEAGGPSLPGVPTEGPEAPKK